MTRFSATGRVLCGLLMLAMTPLVSAQQLLFHFPLDGTADALGWGARESRIHVLDGGAAPRTVPGKFGNALYFEGNAVIAMPFELDMVTYPKVTVTAWVKVDKDSTGERTVFSAGNGNVPRLIIYGTKAAFHAARTVDMARTMLTQDEWVFVAGSIDVETATSWLFQGELAQSRDWVRKENLYPPSKYPNPDDESLPPMPYVFVGSHAFNQWRANKMAIDDVRVYAGVLSAEQIAGLRAGQDIALADNAGSPSFYSGGLTQENVDDLARDRAERAGPTITYASEEEALAAQERREREAAEAASQAEAAAAAQLPYYPVGNPAFSAVAGQLGKKSRMYDLETVFIRRIEARQFQNGRTCEIKSIAWDGQESVSSDSYASYTCKSGHEHMEWIEVALDRNAAIGSIRTCSKPVSSFSGRQSILALSITGSRINADGSTYYGFDKDTDSSPFSHCGGNEDAWSGQMLCPTNPEHLATGLVVHEHESTGEIVGLQLICRRIGTR